MRKLFYVMIYTAVIAMGVTGCHTGGADGSGKTSQAETQTAAQAQTAEEKDVESASSQAGVKESAASAAGELRTITDSAGRQVEIPDTISKIAPSGPLAQIVLYTLCPDKLSGLSTDFSEEAVLYIDPAYSSLPKFGQFYGKNASLNMEALLAAAPDVIIDIGEAKKTVKEDMDALQKQLGIPVIFVKADLSNMAEAYKLLGEITGDFGQAEKLAAYCSIEVKNAEEIAAKMQDGDKKSVYFAMGDDGLSTNAKGSIHAEVIDVIGAVNAADVEASSKGGGSQISFEQLLLWQPDFIIADSAALYNQITTDSVWAGFDAVAAGRVYKIPTAPYSFMNNPPSVNRMIGIQWLGSLVYPEQYTEDLKAKVKDFLGTFYHLEVTEEQLAEILKNAM